MNKYDALRYALNNNNRLPLERTPRPRNTAVSTPKPEPFGTAPKVAPASRLSTVGRTARAIGGKALGAASLIAHSKDAGVGSDKPRNYSGRVMGMTKGETLGNMMDVNFARKSIPMSKSQPPTSAKRLATKVDGAATRGKSSFSAAFAAARKAGKKTFKWSGKRYTTKVK